MKEKIVEMLGAGITPVQVALACGVTESYISQLLSDPEIETQVKELRVQKASAYIESDAALDTDEEVARKLVRRNLDNALLKPMEALKHFQVLNAARRKSEGAGSLHVPTSTVVNLNLPQAAMEMQVKLTTDKQVIEINGRSMAAMPAQQVTKMLRERQAKETLEAALTEPKMKITTPSLLEQL